MKALFVYGLKPGAGAKLFLLVWIGASLVSFPWDVADAVVYKWKDENGTMHYTDNLSKVPRKYRPKPRESSMESRQAPVPAPAPERGQSSGKPDSSSQSRMEGEMGEGFGKMGEELGKGMAKGMEKMGEALGKAFEGLGELMVLAQKNQPDEKKTTFNSQEEEMEYRVKEVLLGAFMLCQAQYIMAKSKTCSKEGPKGGGKDGWKMKEDPEKKKLYKDYEFKIDPSKNTRGNLLIRAYHKKLGGIWQITHEGKPSIRKSSDQKRT